MNIGKRRDTNTQEIMIAILESGWKYVDTADFGRGFPDCIAYRYINNVPVSVLIEIKTDTGTLTKAEERFHERYADLVYVCRNEFDVKKLLREYEIKLYGS